MDGINTCAAPLDIDPRQRYFTTVQPFSYRDTLTVLGYVQELSDHLDELREQLDNLAKDENMDVDTLTNLIKNVDSRLGVLADRVEDLAAQIGTPHDMQAYNPTTGRYETSQPTNRDLFRELAVYGARVEDLATISTAEAANHSCLETAVIGNHTIFGATEPRVTPVNERSMA